MNLHADVIQAIQTGDLNKLNLLLTANPGLATGRIDGQRTLLHVATDWPGHFPNVAATIHSLTEHGADVNAAFIGKHSETPLHWAASSDDVPALDALLDHGANIEAMGAVIGGGTPLADAVAFGTWNAARRLVERGAQTTIWQAAALGLIHRVDQYFQADNPPDPPTVTNAFWNACHGGQLQAAKYLLERGADINWVGHDRLTPRDAAVRNGSAELIAWLKSNLLPNRIPPRLR